jgi:hypothetical protein
MFGVAKTSHLTKFVVVISVCQEVTGAVSLEPIALPGAARIRIVFS